MSTPLQAGYKQTEVGVIPEDWYVKTLSQVGDPVRGGSPRPAGDPRFFNGSNMPWLTVAALTNIPASQLVVTETATCLTEEGSLRSRTLLPGTLIIANSGATLGVSKILGIKCCANDGIAAILNISRDVSAEYLAHFINTKTIYLREVVATGNGQPNLNTDLIGRFNIPLPPTKAEQEAIAEALSDADTLIESVKQLVTKKRRLKQGAMRKFFTDKERSRGFSGNWEARTIESFSAFVTKGATPTTYGFDWEDDGVLFLRSECVSADGLDLKQSMFISEAAHLALNRGEVRDGDLLMTITGNVGRVVRLPDHFGVANINQHIARIRIRAADVSPAFVFHFLSQAKVREKYALITTGQAFPQISLKQVRETLGPLPSFSEQNAISTILSDMDVEIAELEAQLAKIQTLKQGMMNELLTGKIRLI